MKKISKSDFCATSRLKRLFFGNNDEKRQFFHIFYTLFLAKNTKIIDNSLTIVLL